MQSDYITPAGYQKLVATKLALEERLHRAGQEAGAAAGENRDWHDNPGYDLAIADMQLLGSQLAEVEHRLAVATVVDQPVIHERVTLGHRVRVVIDESEEYYQIGGEGESDRHRRVISYSSPLGRALVGAEVGETRTVDSPGGSFNVRIIAIEQGAET
jgi:transcription elongation factor GreA